MKKIHFILLVLVWLFASCKKETAPKNNTDPNLLFLENAVSDACKDSDFFIKGEFNGHEICFATTGPGGSYVVDTFMNSLNVYKGNDELDLRRQNANGSITIALSCGQTHIKDRSLPYSQPHPNLENCEFTEVRLTNMSKSNSATQNWPQSPFNNNLFLGYTGFGMNFTFTSLSPDNIVEGNFEGTMKTDNGTIINVKNGRFRIRFVIVEIRNGEKL